MKDRRIHTLDDAVLFIKKYDSLFKIHGYTISLLGSVLKGKPGSDIDIMALPVALTPDYDKLLEMMKSDGWNVSNPYNCRLFHATNVKFVRDGLIIDALFQLN